MTQLSFVFSDRWEIGPSRTSWVENGSPVFVYVGAHSVDFAWSFWAPWDVKTWKA